jgi:surface protein
VSNWNIGGVENMSSMFYSCRSLRELDLSSWDTTNVKFMPFMFGDCINLTTIYASSKFNISGLEYGSGMFYDASNLV